MTYKTVTLAVLLSALSISACDKPKPVAAEAQNAPAPISQPIHLSPALPDLCDAFQARKGDRDAQTARMAMHCDMPN